MWYGAALHARDQTDWNTQQLHGSIEIITCDMVQPYRLQVKQTETRNPYMAPLKQSRVIWCSITSLRSNRLKHPTPTWLHWNNHTWNAVASHAWDQTGWNTQQLHDSTERITCDMVQHKRPEVKQTETHNPCMVPLKYSCPIHRYLDDTRSIHNFVFTSIFFSKAFIATTRKRERELTNS